MPLYFIIGFFLTVLTSYVIVSDMETKNKNFFYAVVGIIVVVFILFTIFK